MVSNVGRMSTNKETPESLEPDAGNAGHAILRKRVTAALALVLLALMNTLYLYHRSEYLRRNGDWGWFWGGEVLTGVWLVFGVVQVLRKGP